MKGSGHDGRVGLWLSAPAHNKEPDLLPDRVIVEEGRGGNGQSGDRIALLTVHVFITQFRGVLRLALPCSKGVLVERSQVNTRHIDSG